MHVKPMSNIRNMFVMCHFHFGFVKNMIFKIYLIFLESISTKLIKWVRFELTSVLWFVVKTNDLITPEGSQTGGNFTNDAKDTSQKTKKNAQRTKKSQKPSASGNKSASISKRTPPDVVMTIPRQRTKPLVKHQLPTKVKPISEKKSNPALSRPSFTKPAAATTKKTSRLTNADSSFSTKQKNSNRPPTSDIGKTSSTGRSYAVKKRQKLGEVSSKPFSDLNKSNSTGRVKPIKEPLLDSTKGSKYQRNIDDSTETPNSNRKSLRKSLSSVVRSKSGTKKPASGGAGVAKASGTISYKNCFKEDNSLAPKSKSSRLSSFKKLFNRIRCHRESPNLIPGSSS